MYCCCCSVSKLCPTVCNPWTAACQVPLSSTISWSLLKLMSVESLKLSNRLILCHSLLLLPAIFPNIRVFSNEQTLHTRWTEYWSFSNSPSKEYSGLKQIASSNFSTEAFSHFWERKSHSDRHWLDYGNPSFGQHEGLLVPQFNTWNGEVRGNESIISNLIHA